MKSAGEPEMCCGHVVAVKGAGQTDANVAGVNWATGSSMEGKPGPPASNAFVSARFHAPGIRQFSYRNESRIRSFSVTEYMPDQSALAETRVATAGPPVVLPSVSVRPAVSPLMASRKSGIWFLLVL